MKPREIKGARTRLGYTQQFMADQLDLTKDSYVKRENGVVRFTDTQKVKIARLLELTPSQMNEFLYDGALPIGVDGSMAL